MQRELLWWSIVHTYVDSERVCFPWRSKLVQTEDTGELASRRREKQSIFGQCNVTWDKLVKDWVHCFLMVLFGKIRRLLDFRRHLILLSKIWNSKDDILNWGMIRLSPHIYSMYQYEGGQDTNNNLILCHYWHSWAMIFDVAMHIYIQWHYVSDKSGYHLAE